jgi:hypothetical protein
MSRIPRALLGLFFAIAVALGVGPAHAQEMNEAPPIAAPKHDSPVLPRDMPVLVTQSQVTIPTVPPSYRTRDLGWLKLAYPPAAEERVAPILAEADEFKTMVSERLGQDVLSHVEVRITPTFGDMTRLAPIGAPPPGYASGVAYSRLHLVLISLLPPRGADAVDVLETWKHEMVHIALDDATRGQHVPVWFNEGLAIYLSGEHSLARQQTLMSATFQGRLIPFQDLDRSFPSDTSEVNVAYAESADVMRFLMQRTDQARFASMIDRVRDGQQFDRAAADAYGSDLRKLEFQWVREAEHRYSMIPVLTGGGVIWAAVLLALVAAYVKRRRRTKAILEKWEKEEAAEDERVARAAAVANDDLIAPLGASLARQSVKVEHEGGWHTLH